MIDHELIDPIMAYVCRYGRERTGEAFGVSRRTLWRFLERGHMEVPCPLVVQDTVGGSIEALEAAMRCRHRALGLILSRVGGRR